MRAALEILRAVEQIYSPLGMAPMLTDVSASCTRGDRGGLGCDIRVGSAGTTDGDIRAREADSSPAATEAASPATATRSRSSPARSCVWTVPGGTDWDAAISESVMLRK